MKNFKQLKIWKRSLELSVAIIKNSRNYPSENRFDLTSQIIRSSVSIPSNIAEGSSRRSKKEFARFLDIAKGSANELETQLIIALAIGFEHQEIIEQQIKEAEELQSMIASYIKFLGY